MVRMTKKQQQWKPGQRKKQSSVKKMFASTVLTLEALVAFFGTLATFGLHFNDGTGTKTVIWVCGLALALAFVMVPAFLSKSWGYGAGWVLQALLILSGFALPAMFFVGICFALAYWYAVHTGEKLDQENARREREQIEWEKRNPAG